jgi:hypothetical protein
VHVADPHTAVLSVERLDLYPYPRQPLAFDHVNILRRVPLHVGLENGP